MKKRLMSLFFTVVMLFTLIPMLEISAMAEAGESEEHPVLIHSYTELTQFATDVNGGASTSGKFYKIADDFPTSGTELTISIAIATNPFDGCFDGNNKTIKLDMAAASV